MKKEGAFDIVKKNIYARKNVGELVSETHVYLICSFYQPTGVEKKTIYWRTLNYINFLW